MRRILRKIASGETSELGGIQWINSLLFTEIYITTLSDPDCVKQLIQKVENLNKKA